VSAREAASVAAFEQSDKAFHIIRDHPKHRIPILGGLWTAKVNKMADVLADTFINKILKVRSQA
jgi:hypothetical protein